MTPQEMYTNIIGEVTLMLEQKGISFTIENISMDDKQTLQLYLDGDVKNIWQTSEQCAKYYKRIHGFGFTDLVNTNALYRPDLGFKMKRYIDLRNGLVHADYIHPILEPVLKNTCGLLLFHEQAIEILMKAGNLSLAESMLLKRILAKKLSGKNDYALKTKFFENARVNNIPGKIITDIMNCIIDAMKYGLPRIYHITEQNILGFQTAYLKAHYRKEYLLVLTNFFQKEDAEWKARINDEKRKLNILKWARKKSLKLQSKN